MIVVHILAGLILGVVAVLGISVTVSYLTRGPR